jgi:hypothetical protein
LGVIGYSVLPLNIAVLIITVIPEIAFSIIVRVRPPRSSPCTDPVSLSLADSAMVTVMMLAARQVLCTFWAAFSAGTLLAQFPQEKMRDKQIMLSYPILLLFIYFISLCSGV